MKDGHYSKRQRETGYQIEPHFFDPSVLDKYRDDPHYTVTERRVSTKDEAPSHVESSGIQQYVWGHEADGSPCVVVILAHLCSLSTKDQEYWQLHELPPKESATAKIDHRYAKPMWEGEFPDTTSGYCAIFLYLREIQKVFEPDTLFPNFDGRFPEFLAYFIGWLESHAVTGEIFVGAVDQSLVGAGRHAFGQGLGWKRRRWLPRYRGNRLGITHEDSGVLVQQLLQAAVFQRLRPCQCVECLQ